MPPMELPATVGANLHVKVVLWPAGIETGSVKPLTEYPAPAVVMDEIETAAPPVLVTVMV